MSALDDLLSEYEIARTHDKGTDMERIGKQIVAAGGEVPAPPAEPVPAEPAATKREAAELREAAADDAPDAKATVPKGRTTARQHRA